MDAVTVAQLSAVVSVACSMLAFYLGRHVERVEWNKLIEKGILPRPRSAK